MGLDMEQQEAARAFGRAQRDLVLGWARRAAIEQGLQLPGGVDPRHLTIGAMQAAFGSGGGAGRGTHQGGDDEDEDEDDDHDDDHDHGAEGGGINGGGGARGGRRQSQSGATKALRAALLEAARLRPGSVATAAHPELALWVAWAKDSPGELLPALLSGPVARAARQREETAVAAAVREARRTATADLLEV